MNTFKIGDIVKIVDGGGSFLGNKGDQGRVIKLSHDFHGSFIKIKLISGKDKGQFCSRYEYKYKKVEREWDE